MAQTSFFRTDARLIVGAKDFQQKTYESFYAAMQKSLYPVALKVQEGDYGFLEMAFDERDLGTIASMANFFRDNFRTVVVLGMGGSSGAGRMFCGITRTHRDHPRLIFLDNLDEVELTDVLTTVDPKTTGFLVISKSGTTTEVLFQMARAMEYFKDKVHTSLFQNMFTVVTEPAVSPLRTIGFHFGFRVFDHPPVGGRFSAFSVVGLLPAAIIGLDIRKIRQGAAHFCSQVFAGKRDEPLQGAALALTSLQDKKVGTHIMMPYVHRMRGFCLWWRQLWGETLGKSGCGFLPVCGIGPADQHSQLQLYLDGAQRYFLTLIYEDAKVESLISPMAWDFVPEFHAVSRHHIGEVVKAQCLVTGQLLAEKKHDVRMIVLEQWDEYVAGALCMHMFLEALLLAQHWGIDALSQHAVERAKTMTKDFLREK